ncbi:MAG: hypothetical protein AAF191_03590 [Verrucomicrobiota bacterium]
MSVPELFPILACPSCRFDDSQATIAANMAIGVMILFLVCVLSCFLLFIRKMILADRANHSS